MVYPAVRTPSGRLIPFCLCVPWGLRNPNQACWSSRWVDPSIGSAWEVVLPPLWMFREETIETLPSTSSKTRGPLAWTE